jgi:hypothetical protein
MICAEFLIGIQALSILSFPRTGQAEKYYVAAAKAVFAEEV